MRKRYKQLSTTFLISMLCVGLTTVDANAFFPKEGEKYKTKNYNSSYIKSMKSDDTYYPPEYLDDIENEAKIKVLKTKSIKKYEIAIAHSNGEYSYVSSTNDLDEAINKAESLENIKKNEDDMYVVIDKDGYVTYSSKSIARLVGSSGSTVNVYTTSSGKTAHTYINPGYVDDMPIVDQTSSRVKVEVGGYTGWVTKGSIVQVPINQVKNPSYYMKNSDGGLVHYISSDITDSGEGHSREVGKAPSFMSTGKKYYSYDGNYFYTSLNTLTTDGENNTHKNAVNDEAYYNYYTHLPARTKTSYTSNDINKYINNNTPSKSILRGEGAGIIDAQNKYGINASFILGVAMNESGMGTSNIAITKNNIFGLNAVDSSPNESANYFESVAKCVEEFSRHWMSVGYINPKDWRYNGGSLGNKAFGANVKYASDPYWGEKAASFMYEMDEYLGGDEHGKYKLGIYTGTNKVTNSSNHTLYDIKSSRSKSGKVGDVVAITDSTSSEYKVNADRPVTMTTDYKGDYNWDGNYYINKSNVDIINTPTNSDLNQDQINAINMFEKFYIYGPFTDPSIDLSNDDELIKSYSQAVGILRTTENGKVYDRQRFIDAWSKLSSSEKSHPKMQEIYKEYKEIISIAEAAKACFEFFDNVKSNANDLKLDRLSAIELNSKENLEDGSRGKAYKEYMEATKYGENSSNSKRMNYINDKYLDALRYLNAVDHLVDNEVDNAKSEANKIEDTTLKNIALDSISSYSSKYSYNERQVLDRFERFYIYGPLDDVSIDLSDKKNLIKSYSQATGILKTVENGKKYDRQYFLDAWNKLSSSEKSSQKMQEVLYEYKKIVSISEAAKYCFEFFDNIKSNANDLNTDRISAIELNSKENLEDGSRGKAYKEYMQATKYGENSSSSERMKYINQRYLDALRFLNATNYMVDNEISDAKSEMNKISDSTLKSISSKTISSYEGRYNYDQREAFNALERFFIYGPLDDMVINLLDKDDTIDNYSQATGILKTVVNGKLYDRERAQRALDKLSTSEKNDPIMNKYYNEFYDVVDIAEAAKACYKFFDDVSKNANTLIKDHQLAINLNSKDNDKFGARGYAYDKYMKATKSGENSKNSGRMKSINTKYVDAVYFLRVSEYLGKNDIDTAKTYVSKIKDSKLKSIASQAL